MRGVYLLTQPLLIDYEKAFDSIQSQILFDILKSINIPDTLLKAIMDIHTKQYVNKI
jgi:hypothetical protein